MDGASFSRALRWVLLAMAAVGSRASAPAATRQPFERGEPSWQLAGKDCDVLVVSHERTLRQSHTGQASEYLRLQCGRGSKVYFSHRVPPARVIDELVPSVWVKSPHPGIQLLVRIVLPHSLDPDRGGPITALLEGSVYDGSGSWRRLSVEKITLKLMREARLLRQRFGPRVDVRQAYMDLAVLNVYSQTGTVELWIDDLEVEGHVAADAASAAAASGVLTWSARLPLEPAAGTSHGGRVQLSGSVLNVAGRPRFVRMIEHCGESFQFLRSLGFNAVKLRGPPTPSQLQQAEWAGVWLVAPPPKLSKQAQLSSAYNRVVAWDLGRDLSPRDLAAAQRRADTVRAADGRLERPLLCSAASGLWHYSRLADILLLENEPIGSTFELGQFGAWLRERGRLARAGTPIWAAIQTEAPAALAEQAVAFAGSRAPPISVQPDQIRLLAYQAVAAGVRGLCFRSRSRLDGDTPQAELRAASLRLLNLQLSPLAPWAAAGSCLQPIQTTDPQVTVSVLQTEQSRLLIAIRQSLGQQYVLDAGQKTKVAFVDTGASAGAKPYRFSVAAGLCPVDHTRQAGLRISVDEVCPIAVVVLTQQPLVVDHLASRPAQVRRKAAQLRHEIASRWFEVVSASVQSAGIPLQGRRWPVGRLIEAQGHLRRCERLLTAGDDRSANRLASEAMRSLAEVCRALWEGSVRSSDAPPASPFARTFTTLPLDWSLAAKLPAARWSANMLAGGDFEDLQAMRQQGWRNERDGDPAIFSAVSLSAKAARSGRTGLRVRTWVAEHQTTPGVVETPPVRLTSAPVRVRKGQLVRIEGWAKLPQPLAGSREGLLVYDSLSGPALAERVREAGSWRRFTLLRIAPRDGEIAVHFAVTGLGEVWLDDVTLRLAELPADPPRSQADFSRRGPAAFLRAR